MNPNITFTEESLLEMARRQQAFLNQKSVRKDGKPVGLLFCLQSLSRAMWAMSYEELKATVFDVPERAPSQANPVWLLSYGSETVLTLHGNYVSCQAPGTDMETPFHALQAQADTLAAQHGGVAMRCELPQLLREDWEMDELIELAAALQIFTHPKPLWYLLNEGTHRYFFDGSHCGYGINDQFEVDEDDPFSTILWFVECEDGFEDYITFADLKVAEPQDAEGRVWMYPRSFGGTSGHVQLEVL